MMREKSWRLTLLFCVIWALTLFYGEMFAFWAPFLRTYSWPNLRNPSNSSLINGGHPNDFVKVAVITDPQLEDRTSHNLAPRSLALEITQFYSDLYMRRAFLSTIMPLKPDVILFLGDYFNGGPQLSNEEWQQSLNRFKHIFDLGKRERTKDIPVYYIPGNHDVDYAGKLVHTPEVIKRYETHFGARNHRFTIGKVDFIAIDAQTVDGNSENDLTSWTWNFVNNVSFDGRTNPRVLLTHIPLYRPDWTSCGPYRTSEVINQRISRSVYDGEIIYQNYVTGGSSKRLLDLIKPVLVLSGHDHDQCTVTHKTKDGTVKEHTVGTVSWQVGNLYPSFMLLSIGNFAQANGSSDPAILIHLCFLPTQLFIYIWYIILFVVTILALSLWPTHGLDIGYYFSNFITNIKKLVSESVTKEKNEDENCEYEMMWDAEGGMHLVKKPREVRPTSSKDMNSIERGNAVMRAARRQMLHDQDAASLKVDSEGEHAGLSNAKTFLRSRKAVLVLHRCLRVLGMVFVIALVNVPVYMILLFKDWVEQ